MIQTDADSRVSREHRSLLRMSLGKERDASGPGETGSREGDMLLLEAFWKTGTRARVCRINDSPAPTRDRGSGPVAPEGIARLMRPGCSASAGRVFGPHRRAEQRNVLDPTALIGLFRRHHTVFHSLISARRSGRRAFFFFSAPWEPDK